MKKGFTLVELLAVIVILAIILAIAIPSISSLINDAKKNSFLNGAKLLSKSLKNQYDSDSMVSGSYANTFIFYNNGVKTTYPTSNNLDFNISAKDGGIVVYSDGTIIMSIYDGTNCVTKSRTSNDFTISTTTKADCIANIYYNQASAPFTSLIANGDFSSAITGWSVAGGTNSIVNNKLRHTSNGNYAHSQPWYNFSFSADHKYYVSLDYSSDSQVTALLLRWMLNNGVSAEGLATLGLSPLTKRYSGVHTIISANNYSYVGLNILQYAPANYGFYVDNLYLIDLTSIYGSGNEPTKDQMDNNINKVWIDSTTNTPKYFTGSGWLNF